MSDLDTRLSRLSDYLRRHASSAESADDYEQDLFERALAGAAPELDLHQRLEATFRDMDTRGTLDLWLTAREVAQLDTRGLRLRHHTFDPANPQSPDLSGEFDLLVTKVLFDLSGVRRVDAEFLTPDGRQIKVMRDIGFDPNDRAVFMCCEPELARASAGIKTVTRVWGHDDSGRRLLAEFGAVE